MEEENYNCKRCDQVKKNEIFSNCFTNYLNAFALVLISIILIIFVFYTISFAKKNIEYNKNQVKHETLNFKNSDSLKFESVLNVKLNAFKEEIKNEEKQRNENMKYYGSLVGFILSIVGFFGFKSIHDTRQSALEIVKNKAEEVAQKTTKENISELSKSYVESFLKNEGKKDIENIAEKISSEKSIEVASSSVEGIKTDNIQYRNAIQEDIKLNETTQKHNFNFLLKRIQELENKVYGGPDIEDDDGTGFKPTLDPNSDKPVI